MTAPDPALVLDLLAEADALAGQLARVNRQIDECAGKWAMANRMGIPRRENFRRALMLEAGGVAA
jgi:hypothetical protein